ncbi:MAG TPA: pyruvate, phosphate dikinase [Pyrinomonadaceae bacterium]|nr:pyruvate, phosphate dikinase [Pyrinomonadaceae bacterium]
MEKWIYLFEDGGDQKSLFGGKGVVLCEMTRAGLPIPPGLIVTTQVCNAYHTHHKQFPEGMWDQLTDALREIEKNVGKKFGDPKDPLLVSVRPGAAFSMPGMMDTVLNVGLNEETARGLAEQTDDLRFALDTYRRSASLFGEIVLGVAHEKFERVIDGFRVRTTGGRDTDLKAEELREIIAAEREIIRGEQLEIPDDPYEQLRMAIAAVFNSWMGRRAIDYRHLNRIPDSLGVAVNVQAMVFGNMGAGSGTGVAFSRNPSTGKKELYGEYLLNAQGEDVISGIRTPSAIGELRNELPSAYADLIAITELLEQRYRDMQDYEFTIERGKVWLLQTRTAKRSGFAGLRLVLDFLDEGLISEKQSILRISPSWISERFAPKLPRNLREAPLAVGLPASPGVAIGVVALSPESVDNFTTAGKPVVFVCHEASPDYFHAMSQSEGVVSLRGGMTSHAAVVCRGMTKPCVAGIGGFDIDYDNALLKDLKGEVSEGDLITVDGHSGRIYRGAVELVKPSPDEDVRRIGSLLWRADARDYLEDGLGLLWELRDIIRDQGLQRTSLSNPTGYRPLPEQTSLVSQSYISFVQPPPSEVGDIFRALHWDNSGDTNIIGWSILYELQRQLQNEIGIGNHPLAIRPLNDPELTFFDRDSFSLLDPVASSNDYSNRVYQLVGLEFFGINRFLRHALPWGCLQWWGAVQIDSSLGDAWQLDRINPTGESLVARSHELAAQLIILDNERLRVDETRRWYQLFRERELGWSWYKDNDLSSREVVESLQDLKMGVPVNEQTMIKLRGVGLLSAEMELTSQGLSLIESQTACERKHLSFEGRILSDDR